MDYKRVLRLHYVNGFSSRTIAESTGDGKTTVNEFLRRFRENDVLSWPLSDDVTNEQIGKLLYQKPGNVASDILYRGFDEETVHRKLARKGETLLHLWKLYNAEGEVDGKRPLSYRQFCRRYSNWLDNKNVTFHIQRYPGVNLELDYAGKTLAIHDLRNPGQTTKVTIFVATLSFSDYFYIEGMTDCKDWINPALNEDFQAWAEHNGTVILPAKVRKPRWKPNVEGHVKIITMHILVEMEEMTFYSLEELNIVLWEKMERENRVNFSKLSYSRRDLFESEEKESLLPLPETKYEYLERKTVTVNPDFSFVFDQVHYSMPRKYLRKKLDIRAGSNRIYVYNESGDLIRTHERSYTPKSWVVIPEDMPKEYSDYGSWNVPYFLLKAGSVGPDTRLLIQKVIEKSAYPVQSFRSCFGILRFADKYGKDALEKCCRNALISGKCSYNYICNTVSMYARPKREVVDRTFNTLKPADKTAQVTGIYKDDDDKYSLENLLKAQEGGDLQ